MKNKYIVIGIMIYMIPIEIISFGNLKKMIKKTTNNVVSTVSTGSVDIANTIARGASDTIEIMSDPIDAIKEAIRKKYPFTQALTDDQLQVRQGTHLCQKELNFIKNRTPKVNQALKQYFDIDMPLKIGLCFSGGGNRAMLVSLGFLLGAQDIGLYDSTYYTAALSGSTWTIVPFSFLNSTQGMSLTGFKDQLIVRLDSVMKTIIPGTLPVPVFTDDQNKSMQNNFAKRFAYDQYLSSIDLYGTFIGNFTLLPAGDNRLDLTWSSIADKIEEGNIPLPMGSVIADRESNKDSYYWFEVGPFEVGSDQIGSYVPIQAFGSKFKHGRVVSGYAGHAPEYPMSFYEGVFGSAFVASMNEMDRLPFPNFKINIFGKNYTVKISDAFTGFSKDKWLSNNVVSQIRFFPACFHNYTLGLEGSPISNQEKLKLYDGGLNFDMPFPLIMRPDRGIDLIIACDAMIDLSSLKLPAVHFKRNNIKFPDMSNVSLASISKVVTVFNDPRSVNYDKDMVTIMYCPFIKNDGFSTTFDPAACRESGYCKMLNFNYTQEQAEQVIGVTRYNINSMKDEIKAVLQALQKQKTTGTSTEINHYEPHKVLTTIAPSIAPTQINTPSQDLIYINVTNLNDKLIAAKVKSGNSVQSAIDGKNLYALSPNTTYYTIMRIKALGAKKGTDRIISKKHRQSEFIGKTTWDVQSDIIS